MAEKRSFPRLHRDCFVELYMGAGGKHDRAVSRDVSLGGVAFENMEPVEPGRHLKLVLSKLDVAHDMKVDCVVRRCEPVKDGKGYLVAVEFYDVSHSLFVRLQDFLQISSV